MKNQIVKRACVIGVGIIMVHLAFVINQPDTESHEYLNVALLRAGLAIGGLYFVIKQVRDLCLGRD